MMLYTLEDKALTSLNNYVRITIDTLFEKHLVEFEKHPLHTMSQGLGNLC